MWNTLGPGSIPTPPLDELQAGSPRPSGAYASARERQEVEHGRLPGPPGRVAGESAGRGR
jgi:hypothetical protein